MIPQVPTTPERVALCAAIVNACRENGWGAYLAELLDEQPFQFRTTDDLRAVAERCGRTAVTPAALPLRKAFLDVPCICDDTGWIDGEPHATPHHTYTVMKPCRCTKGHQAGTAWQAARERKDTDQ